MKAGYYRAVKAIMKNLPIQITGHVVVPHPRKDIPIGTLRNIYRQAGWNW